MGDLTIRDEHMIALGEQAEAYLEHKAQQHHQHGSSLSHSSYDVDGSRADWERNFQ